ncbi:helix-turn-helix transcriptional regulator [Streptomyces sp. DSM 44917]|uniref:Helix-turn-helix transcriptional regulator n=1 Tax=Streptomyces boetiae TaxID=3075541 RepID=A0ABU2L4E8_9ACTN|nr:helix-turn-helix transcriptional regulator [Streptomyces sp. DSM 44917]MDT0306436.1 helix-turn-helix transcriptional regulator [Streptomyces sp. DSM 44917]
MSHDPGSELGRFIRARREAVTPALAGLPAGPRRRTPGLRRAELATLAGVSVEYLTRLEQGRDRRPSAAVLGTLAEALRLSPAERVHLYRLSKAADGFSCAAASAGPPIDAVRPTVRAVLAGLEPAPAVLLNRVNDILGCTDAFRALAAPLGLLEGPGPNLTRFVFADPRARRAFPDWEALADEQVAALKEGSLAPDGQLAQFMDELSVTVGAPFARRVVAVPGPARPTGELRLAHPEAGELRLAYETLDLSADVQRIRVHLPADAATAEALAVLTGRGAAALRAVPA